MSGAETGIAGGAATSGIPAVYERVVGYGDSAQWVVRRRLLVWLRGRRAGIGRRRSRGLLMLWEVMWWGGGISVVGEAWWRGGITRSDRLRMIDRYLQWMK